MVTFQLARSASLFETGRGRGIGFRDSNQDCLGVVHMVPDEVRERLIHLAATQKSDGSAYHQYQPLTRTGNAEIGGGFNDDPLWLVLERRRLRARDRPRGPARRRRPVRGRAGWRRHDARPPRGVAALHAGAARRARAAADRPRRLERLPQPQRALDRSGRVVPDRADALERPRGIGDDRRAVRAGGTRIRARSLRQTRPRRITARPRMRWRPRSRRTAGTANGSCARTTTPASRSAAAGNDEGQIFLEPQALCAMAGIGADAGLRRSRAAERLGAARLPIRRAAARSAVSRLPQRARRDLDLPAGLQGKRLGVLPHESVAHHRRGACAAAPTGRCRCCAPSRRPTSPIRTRAAPSPTCTRRWSPARRRRSRARPRIRG